MLQIVFMIMIMIITGISC